MIQVLERAAKVVRVLAEGQGRSFTEVWRASGLNKATASHILATLVSLEWAEKTEDGRYRVGPEAGRLARSRQDRVALAEAAEETARALSAELGVMVSVSALIDGDRVRLVKTSGEGSLTVSESVEAAPGGMWIATGRVMAAYADEKALARIIEKNGLPGERWPEGADAKSLKRRLAEIREAGVADMLSGDGQVETLAAPVFEPGGAVAAAVGLAAPAHRLKGAERQRCVSALRAAAERMTAALRLRMGRADG